MQFLVIRNIPIKKQENLLYLELPKEEIYTYIPKEYNFETWPKTTNNPCYMCTIVTKRTPIFVPSMIFPDGTICRGNNSIVCSPACGMSWIYEKANDDSEIRRHFAYMVQLIHQMVGVSLKVVERAMDRSELQKFGGRYTEHQYQREILSLWYMEKFYISHDDYISDLS